VLGRGSRSWMGSGANYPCLFMRLAAWVDVLGRAGRILTLPPIGSDAGDCAPAPSHTTGRAVCSHPAVEHSFRLHGEARSDGIQNP
jgi:hypothetical protein